MKSRNKQKGREPDRVRRTAKGNAPAKIGPDRGVSKQQGVLDLLQRPDGATVAAMVKSTGWQPHSVRGFLAGVVRKKLGLNVVSEKTDIGRIYRIATTDGGNTSRSKQRGKAKAG